jgi:hypothetical protein
MEMSGTECTIGSEHPSIAGRELRLDLDSPARGASCIPIDEINTNGLQRLNVRPIDPESRQVEAQTVVECPHPETRFIAPQ